MAAWALRTVLGYCAGAVLQDIGEPLIIAGQAEMAIPELLVVLHRDLGSSKAPI
jgi:hypothetical protein